SPSVPGRRSFRVRGCRPGDHTVGSRISPATAAQRAMSSTAPVNISAPLSAMAMARPHTLAVVEPQGTYWDGRLRYAHLTYRELHDDSDRLATGLERLGVHRGVRTALMVPPGLDFYALTFALFKIGAVVVLIDPGMGVRGLGTCLAEAEPEAFIGVPKA